MHGPNDQSIGTNGHARDQALQVCMVSYLYAPIFIHACSHACTHARLLASRITTGLQVPNTTLPSIEVAPNANFALDVRAELWIEPAASAVDTPWVMLGSLEKRLGYSLLVLL